MKRVIVSLMAATLLIAAPEASQQEAKPEVKVSNETNTTQAKKADFQLKDGTAARVFFSKYVQEKEIKKATIALNNLDLDKNIIKVTIPTVFDCQKSEIKNGTILIEKDIEVTFNFCAFKDLKIENTSDRKTKIEKSIGEVKIKGKNFDFNTVKLEKLDLINSVPNTFIDNSSILKVFFDKDIDDRYLKYENLSIVNSKNILLTNPNKNRSFRVGITLENNSNIEFENGIKPYGKIFNSEVKFENLNITGDITLPLDILNSYIKINNALTLDSINMCIYHNNIEFKFGGNYGDIRGMYNLKNNIIKTEGSGSNIEENRNNIIGNKKDYSKNLATYAGLVLSEDQIPENYISSGVNLKTSIKNCAYYEGNADKYAKYFNYDFNGKKRDLAQPTPGQYEPTKDKVIKTSDYDFEVKDEPKQEVKPSETLKETNTTQEIKPSETPKQEAPKQ